MAQEEGMNVFKKIFSFIVSFFGILSIIAVWLGYSALIYQSTSIAAIAISAIFSFFLVKGIKGKKTEKRTLLLLGAVLLLFSLIFLFLLWPNGVYPSTCNDFMNHANQTKLSALRHGSFPDPGENFSWIHNYPLIFQFSTAILYYVLQNSYIVNSIVSVLFLAATVLGVFLLAKEFLEEKFAVLAAFLFSFSISTFLSIDGGYLPQIMGQLFFLASFYFYIKKNKAMLFLSLVGLWAYAHFFILFFILLCVEIFRKSIKERKFSAKLLGEKFLLPVAASLAILPETLGLFLFKIMPKANKFLIKGGITVPNLIALFAFYPAILGFFAAIKEKKMEELANWVFAGFLFIGFLTGCVVLNFIMRWSPIASIHQLYMPAKIAFLMFIPASIFSAYGLKKLLGKKGKKKKRIVKTAIVLILAFHLLYFAGFALVVSQARSFPVGFYEIGEKINQMEGPFTLGIDNCFLDVPAGVNKYSFPYNSLYDNPDPQQEKNYCRYMEAGRIFHFPWAVHKFTDEIPGADIFDKEGNRVLWFGSINAGDYSMEDPNDPNRKVFVDYFLSDCSTLDKPVVMEKNGIKLYDLRNHK